MDTITVKFTPMQLAQARVKLGLLLNDSALQNTYKVTAEEVHSAYDCFYYAFPGFVIFPRKFAEVLIGEFEALLGAVYSNQGDDEDCDQADGLKQCVARIKAASGME